MVLSLAPVGLSAQSASADSTPVTPVSACPLATCEVALERGTVDGTRLRVGTPGFTVPVGFMGGGVYKRLSVVPSAKKEAAAGRRALRTSFFATAAGLAAAGFVLWYDQANLGNQRPTTRMFGIAGVGVGSLLFWQHQKRASDRHFEEAVRLYNRDRPR